MRTVSRFESDLLRILHCVLGHAPLTQVYSLILRSTDRPRCLSRDCVELVESTLAKGMVGLLASSGGWRRERFLRADRFGEVAVAEGRLWDRQAPEELGLDFSINSLDFLIWLTASDPTSSEWKPNKYRELTIGDQCLIFLAFRAVIGTEVSDAWCTKNLFRNNSLCSLMFPDQFAAWDAVPRPDFSIWLTPAGVGILESLQDSLAARWVEIERAKSKIISINRMQLLGEIQDLVLDDYFRVVDEANRRDLCRFLLMAAADLLEDSPSERRWLRSLKVDGLRLADRMEAYNSAFSFLRNLERLNAWRESALHVGYFDEGYAASQLWKADWERFGAARDYETARRLLRSADLVSGGSTAEGN